jgi:hypothetical protein
MENQHTLSKRQFIISLGSLGAGTLLNSCAGVNQLGGLGNIGLGPGLMPTLLIKPQTMMSKLSPHFPYQQNYQGLVGLNFSDPVISMVPDAEKVRVGLTTLGNIAGTTKQLGGRCQLACGLRYDPETRGIFLKDSTLEEFTLNGVNPQLTSGLKDITNIVGQNILERYPVYTLGNQAGIGLLKSMNVTNEGVRLAFGI